MVVHQLSTLFWLSDIIRRFSALQKVKDFLPILREANDKLCSVEPLVDFVPTIGEDSDDAESTTNSDDNSQCHVEMVSV